MLMELTRMTVIGLTKYEQARAFPLVAERSEIILWCCGDRSVVACLLVIIFIFTPEFDVWVVSFDQRCPARKHAVICSRLTGCVQFITSKARREENAVVIKQGPPAPNIRLIGSN